jgi:hypothetical protein
MRLQECNAKLERSLRYAVAILELDAKGAEEFIKRTSVAAILFFTPADPGIVALLQKFATFVKLFQEDVGFGIIDVGAMGSIEVVDESVVVMTPSLIWYYDGVPSSEVVGLDAVVGELDWEDAPWRRYKRHLPAELDDNARRRRAGTYQEPTRWIERWFKRDFE